MSKRVKDKDSMSTELLSALIGAGATAHQEHVTSLAGTENTPTPFSDFLADHISKHLLSQDAQVYGAFMKSCFGIELSDEELAQWDAARAEEDEGDDPGETYTDPDIGSENQDDGPETENTIEQRAN